LKLKEVSKAGREKTREGIRAMHISSLERKKFRRIPQSAITPVIQYLFNNIIIALVVICKRKQEERTYQN